MQSNVLLYDKKLIDLHMFSIKDRESSERKNIENLIDLHVFSIKDTESCERKYVVSGPLFLARMGNICAK